MMHLPAMAVASSVGLGKRATASALFAGRRIAIGPIAGVPEGSSSRNNRLLAVQPPLPPATSILPVPLSWSPPPVRRAPKPSPARAG